MKIYGLMDYYNGMPTIEYALKQLRKFCDVLIAHDGRWESYDQNNPSNFSTDGSRDIVGQYADIQLAGDKTWKYQIDKRNYTLGQVPLSPDNYLLWIDSDEILAGDFPRTRQLLKHLRIPSGTIPCLELDGQSRNYTRLYLNQHKIRWSTMASQPGYKINNEIVSLSQLNPTLLPLKIFHLRDFRPEAVRAARTLFYKHRSVRQQRGLPW